jgi:fermentation-respiration switch protein FrsA (DUF1100 family)
MPGGIPMCLLRRWMSFRVLRRLAVLAAAGYVAFVLLLLALEDRLIYNPKTAAQSWIEPPPDCRFRDLDLQAEDGTRIHARWFPCSNAQGAILLCHSRGANLSVALMPHDVAAWHRELGLSLLIFDYPGYGRSEGRPSEAGCYSAAAAAYSWLTQVQNVPPRDVVLLGRSLGTAVAVDLASRRTHRALVLISPFTSLPDEAQLSYPFVPAHLLMRNRYDSLSKIAHCPQPLLIVHGTKDRMVPFALGRRLFEAAKEPKRFIAVDGATHAGSVLEGFLPNLKRFLAETCTSVKG